jgi:hypothetical protein
MEKTVVQKSGDTVPSKDNNDNVRLNKIIL